MRKLCLLYDRKEKAVGILQKQFRKCGMIVLNAWIYYFQMYDFSSSRGKIRDVNYVTTPNPFLEGNFQKKT